MAEFHFNAAAYEPWRGAKDDSPHQYALRLWMQFKNGDDDMDLATACELAPYDSEIWCALFTEAQKQDVDAWPLDAQGALGRALARKPMRMGAGVTVRRNDRLRAIAAALVRVYGLKLTQAMPGGPRICAASVLATLPNTPAEGQIAIELTKKKRP